MTRDQVALLLLGAGIGAYLFLLSQILLGVRDDHRLTRKETR